MAAKRGFAAIGLTTNGRRLGRMEHLRTLVANGLTGVTISCHGHTERIHDTLTATAGSFRETAQGLRNVAELRQQGVDIGFVISTVVTKLNCQHVLDMLSFFQTFAPDRIQFTLPQVFGRMLDNFEALMPRYSDVIPIFRQASQSGCGQHFVVAEIPLCLTRQLPPAIVGNRADITFVDGRSRVLRPKDRDFQRTVRGPLCRDCFLQEMCDGIWPLYAKIYGWDEFQPVTEAQARQLLASQASGAELDEESTARVSALLAPCRLGQSILHWRWSRLELSPHQAQLYFQHEAAGTFIVRLLPGASGGECYAASANYRISYDGTSLNPVQRLFLDILVAMIRQNDPPAP